MAVRAGGCANVALRVVPQRTLLALFGLPGDPRHRVWDCSPLGWLRVFWTKTFTVMGNGCCFRALARIFRV